MIQDKTNNGLEGKTFLTILADGKFHKEIKMEEYVIGLDGEKIEEYKQLLEDKKFDEALEIITELLKDNNKGYTIRVVTDKTSKDVSGIKVETLHDSVVGKITGITIIEGKFGKNLQITIDDEVISTGVKGKFGEDLLKKLPAIDYTKDNITLTPYAFIPKGKDNKIAGVSVYQGSIKLGSYYYDNETKKSINGCPEPENGGAGFDSDDWTNHFNTVRKYMIKMCEKLPVYVETKSEELPEVKF